MTGRPTVMTPETLERLRQAFLRGCSDREAVAYAEIALSTLYEYQNKNPDFSEQKASWKTQPLLKARETVISKLDDVDTAMWYLERKMPEEFGKKQTVKHQGDKDEPLFMDAEDPRVIKTIMQSVSDIMQTIQSEDPANAVSKNQGQTD